MPYVKRATNGSLVSLHNEVGEGVDEFLDASHPEIIDFLQNGGARVALSGLAASDLEMARVTEDVIELMISRNLILFTDLPEKAQKKLLKRKELRSTSALDLGLIGVGEII